MIGSPKMMIEDKSPGTPRWVRKLLIPGLVGGVVGYAAAATMMYFIDSSAVGGLGMSATIASLVGVV